MSYSDIYSFERIVEPAIAAVLATASGGLVTAFSSQDVIQFQKTIPRVEIMFTLGAGQNRFVVIDPSTGKPPTDAPVVNGFQGNQLMNRYRRESAWACTVQFAIITAANITDHNAYRATTRASLASLNVFINQALPRHELVFTSDGGSSTIMMDQDKAYFRSDHTLTGRLSVQDNAWALLAT